MWIREPFRVFFPLGIGLAWLGIGHWLAYYRGWISTYSCAAHGLVQIQGFLLAFALGFLLTAIPRRTATEPASGVAIVAAGLLLVISTVATFLERWWLAEGTMVVVLIGVVGFARARFMASGGSRRPPAAFVLLPLGLLCAVIGGVLVAWGATGGGTGMFVIGKLLVTQGMFFCLVMGAGALVLPLMGGMTPPPDLGSNPRVTLAAAAYLAAGLLVIATLVAEASGSNRIAPVLRGLIVAATLAAGAGLGSPLAIHGTNRRVARLAAWLIPVGPIAAGLVPDYRVPALHVTFIAGFGLLALSVATHVTASHCQGLPVIRDGRSTIVRVVAAGLLLTAVARIAADSSNTYFEHLAGAALVWIAVTGLWVARLLPAWAARPVEGPSHG